MQKEVLGSQLQLDLYAILGMFRRDVSSETAPAPEKLPTVHPHRDQDERYNTETCKHPWKDILHASLHALKDIFF